MKTIYEKFAASVRAHGAQAALEVGGKPYTYAELSALADRLAALLLRHDPPPRHRGGGPRPVGLLASRSLTAYAGYLAVQRLGRTVVPMNPAFPVARNATIAAAAGVRLMLTDTQLPAAALPADVVTADAATLRQLAERPVPDLPPAMTAPNEIAYVLFTSGSTGTPKGVPITQANVSAYLDHVVPRYELAPGSRVSQTFDLTFDPSVFDMFASWSAGAALVVPTRQELMSVTRFVTERRISHWFSVPSVVSLAQRLRRLPPGSMPGLRWSLFAGEQLTLTHARAWQAAAPSSRLENIYGPTELTVTCTEYRLPADPSRWPSTANGTVPIGSVYPGLEHRVVGEDGRPAAEGELVVRGAQRFPGYVRPADNVGRFVTIAGETARTYTGQTPLTPRHWYRTGDRVAVRGGDLIHLGRLDQQVKIHGYRVELGEIEEAIRSENGVREAVVVASTDGGQTELAAAFTGPADAAAVLAALRRRLPDYMVLRTAMPLEAFPLNDNGKVDRRALSAAIRPHSTSIGGQR